MHRKKYLYITKVKFDKAIKYSLSSPSYTSISMLVIFVFSLIQLTYKAIKQILETRQQMTTSTNYHFSCVPDLELAVDFTQV